MTEGAWTEAVVRQLWAEGIDWEADTPTAQPIDPRGLDGYWLDAPRCRSATSFLTRIPRRNPLWFPYMRAS